MIYTIDKHIFVFNMPLRQRIRHDIKKQLKVLECLEITDFEFVLLPYSPEREHTMTLYEDPVINIISPFTVETEELEVAAFSAGIMEHVSIDFDPTKGFFRIDQTIEDLIAHFEREKTLLFVEVPRD
jgi:hypothetical protein